MWRPTRNNHTVVGPSPAVQNAIYVITRNLIALTTTDISLSAELVCSKESACRRSRNSRNALRGTYVAVQSFMHILSWLFPGDQPTYYSIWITSKTRPLLLISSIIRFSSTQTGFSSFIILYSYSFLFV